MKRSTKIITGVILTVGIVGGAAAIGKKQFGNHEKRADFAVGYITEQLQLDSTQEQALSVLKDQVMAARSVMHEEMGSTKSEMQELVEAETFNQAQALELINSKTSTINSAAPDVVVALGNFLDSLNAEQKAEVVEFMQKEHHQGRRGKWRH